MLFHISPFSLFHCVANQTFNSNIFTKPHGTGVKFAYRQHKQLWVNTSDTEQGGYKQEKDFNQERQDENREFVPKGRATSVTWTV